MFSWTHGRMVTQIIMGIAFSLTVVAAGSFAASNDAIRWMDDILSAYKRALAESKPLVLVFVHRNSSGSVRFEREVMPSPELAALAGRAIFVRAAYETDDAAKALLEALEIKEIPTSPCLSPTRTRS